MNEFPVTQYEINEAIMRCLLTDYKLFLKEDNKMFAECTRKHVDYFEYKSESEKIKQRRGFA